MDSISRWHQSLQTFALMAIAVCVVTLTLTSSQPTGKKPVRDDEATFRVDIVPVHDVIFLGVEGLGGVPLYVVSKPGGNGLETTPAGLNPSKNIKFLQRMQSGDGKVTYTELPSIM